MKFFVTGVNGQLGHDVMNDFHKRGHEGVGSDIASSYAGVADGSAVTTMPYGNCRLFGIYPFLQQIVMILSTLIQRDSLSIANRAG